MPTAPATTRADRKGRLVRVALVVEYLRGGWRSGQQIMSHVEIESERAGQRTGYNNVQGATRNAKLRALLGGLCWQYMDVNEQMTDAGSAFRLWTVTEEAVPRAHDAWQKGRAEVVMLTGDPQNPTVRRYRRPDLSGAKARTSAEIERREAELERQRGGAEPTLGMYQGNGSTVSAQAQHRGPTAPTSHDGIRLGPEPGPQDGEQRRLL